VEESTDDGYHTTIAKLADGSELPFGMMVWSAGLAPVKFVTNSGLDLHNRGGRIRVDDYLRVTGCKGRVFALGDCAGTESGPLPPTATVAEQQGQYLGDCFNNYYKDFDVLSESKAVELPLPGPIVPGLMPVGLLEPLDKVFCKAAPEFQYKNRGSLAGMGFGGGVADFTQSELPGLPKTGVTGFAAFLAWRGTYLTKQLSWSNMVLVPMHWFKAMVFGRDISRF